MSNPKTFKGPVTGHVYDLEHGEKIDPVKEGIGASGCDSAPSAVVNGREKYARIFIRLRTPAETLTCRPIQNGADFAQRVSILENWFNSVLRKPNMMLTFEARELTDQEAIEMESEK